jgi:hypothetical protein
MIKAKKRSRTRKIEAETASACEDCLNDLACYDRGYDCCCC